MTSPWGHEQPGRPPLKQQSLRAAHSLIQQAEQCWNAWGPRLTFPSLRYGPCPQKAQGQAGKEAPAHGPQDHLPFLLSQVLREVSPGWRLAQESSCPSVPFPSGQSVGALGVFS